MRLLAVIHIVVTQQVLLKAGIRLFLGLGLMEVKQRLVHFLEASAGNYGVCTAGNPNGDPQEEIRQGPLGKPQPLYVVPGFNSLGFLEFSIQVDRPLN
jgi:hypothetical protein